MLTSKTDKQKEKEVSGQSQHRRSAKPLQNKKFYLDLKNQVASNNLEQRLKSLGATVEWFLVKEVNYVVTDRPHWTGTGTGASGSSLSGSTPKCGAIASPSLTPVGGQYSNESPATLDSPGERGGRRRSKSRAEAMLERARLQPQQCTVDPLDNAARWSIPIWPLEKVLKWLDKIYEKYLKVPSSSSQKKPSVIGIRGHFIKLESINQNQKPVYKEFSLWPTINLNFEAGGCPFSPPGKRPTPSDTGKQSLRGNEAHSVSLSTKHTFETPRMTRKVRSRLQRGHDNTVAVNNSPVISGYCEICQLTYLDQKRHIKCDRHVQFVRNSDNFISLDQLIKQGHTMDTFLKLNGANQISPCTGELSGSTRRSLRRLHSFAFGSSASWKTNEQAQRPSPVSSANGHHITRSSTGVRQALEEKNTMLLQQKESLEVQCNGMWSHCYGTRHAGMKSPISGNIARRVQWEMQGEGSCRPQRMRRASASFYGTTSPSLQQQLSPTGSDSGHHLRSRGQLWLPSNLLGTTAEDEARARLGHISADPQPARTYRDIPPAFTEDEKPKVVIKEEVKSPVNRSGNSQAIKRKRLSVEEKLIEDNKAYYKLELKNSKLRSSGYFPSHRDIEIPVKTEVKEEKADSNVVKCNGEQGHEGTKKESKAEEGGAGIKFQRVRKSELTLLSDEAENFMFGEPVRRDSFTESSEEEDEEEEEELKKKVTKNLKKENTKEEVSRKPSSDNKRTFKKKDDEGSLREQPSSVPPVIHLKIGGEDACQGNALHCDESSVDTCSVASSCDTNSATRQKRKRRTHAEAFIHDNLDYYKFEIPGSRLRFQGSILPPTLTPVESNPLPTSNDTKDCSGGKQVTGTPSPKGTKATCNGAHSKIVTCSNEATNEKEKIVHTQEDSKEKVEENENKNLEKQEKEDDRKEEERDESPVKETVEDELLLGMEKLHFSFEVVPQSEPWYRTYTRQDEGEEFYAYSSMSDSCYWKPFLLPYELPSFEAPGSSNSGPGPSGVVKRRRNRFAHMLDKKPRKSPRCHASTLAILSSLRHYRRRKEPDKPKDETPKTEVMNISSEEDNTNGDILDTTRDDSKDVPEDTCTSKDSPATSKDAPGASVNNTIKNTPGTNKDVVSKNVPDVTKDSPGVSKDVDAVKEVAGTSEDASSLSTGAGSLTETTTVVINSDFKSESDPDIHEIARNIDKMFGLGTGGEDLSASENDASSDESKQETNVSHKNRKSVGGKKNVKYQSRKSTSGKGKKGKVDSSKRRDVLEIDPLVLQEFAVELTTKSTVENQCRGGPKMDVVTLLEEFSKCRCMEESATNAPNTSLLLGESSCNSSECGASSTCETVNFSDGPEGRILQIRGRKRKRKKNLTGWPAEKQRGKKKVVGKVSRTDENVPTGVDASKKCAHNSDKLRLSVEGSTAATSEVSRGSAGTVKEVTNKTERPSKSGEKSKVENKTVCSSKLGEKSKVGVCREDTNSGVGKVKRSSGGNCELSVAPEKRASVARTESLDSSGSEYQPCVRVTKISDLAGVMLPNSTSSYLVAGISNSRRLRSSSLSSSPPRISVPVQRKYASLSIDSWKRPVESSSSKRRASPRKSLSRSDAEWTPWCIVRKQR